MANLPNDNMQRYNYLSFEINAAYHDAALKMGLSDSGMSILYTLCIDGGKSLLRDIIRYSGISKQTINSSLRKLEADDIVKLDSTENRKKTVYLTKKGRESVKHTIEPLIKIENEILSSWSKDEAAIYLDLTSRYLTTLKEKIEEEL